ncbi:MAG TPA: hypothetical protein VGL42_03610 [Opitutaceae bacterium]|jgi:hypothetical protein
MTNRLGPIHLLSALLAVAVPSRILSQPATTTTTTTTTPATTTTPSTTTTPTTPTTPSSQQITDLQNQTALATAQQQAVAAQTALVTAQQGLATAIATPGNSEVTALTTALSGLSSAGANMPNGQYAANANGVATPISTEMELHALENLAGKLGSDTENPLPASITNLVLVAPGQEITNQLLYQNFLFAEKGYTDAEKELHKNAEAAIRAVDASRGGPPPAAPKKPKPAPAPAGASIPAPAPGGGPPPAPAADVVVDAALGVVTQLPGIAREIAGFFQTNTTESTFGPSFTGTEAQTMVIGKVVGSTKPKRHVYLTLDAFFRSKYGSPNLLKHRNTYKMLYSLVGLENTLKHDVYELDERAQELSNEASIIAPYLKAVAPASGSASPAVPPSPFSPKSTQDLLTLYNLDNVSVTHLNDISTAINSYITTLNAFVNNLMTVQNGASLPPISMILYEELASDATLKLDDSAQFEVNLDNQLGSILIKTTWIWVKNPIVTSMFGLEYRLVDFNGEVKAAGVLHEADVAPMKKISKNGTFKP